MRVVIDRYIPFVENALTPHAEVISLEPEAITSDVVRDADALIVRTRTKVNKQLLDQSKVQFIATATIGYDHIDADYCLEKGIRWISCPGCNAQAVCDYIEECLTELSLPKGKTVGVVGVGHVGTLVTQMAEKKGYQVLLNDPPKNIGISLNQLAQNSDFITFHTPLIETGSFPTFHLGNTTFFQQCKPQAVIVNTARGGVIDEKALLHSGRPFILDTWENEPHIQTDLLDKALLASYHIAGYSLLGKLNASQMCLDAFSAHFGINILPIDKKSVPLQTQRGDSAQGWLKRITEQLKANSEQFEQLRKAYPLR